MATATATFRHDPDENVWLVEFADLPGCHTYAESLDEARVNAVEALQVLLDQDDVSVTEVVKGS